MIAVALEPLNNRQLENPNAPDWMVAYINLMNIMDFIKGDRQLTDNITQEVLQELKIELQWDQIIFLRNIPADWDQETAINKIKIVVEKQKGRILNPAIDIRVVDQNCIVFLDGWASLDLDEVSQDIRKKEEEQAEAEAEA